MCPDPGRTSSLLSYLQDQSVAVHLRPQAGSQHPGAPREPGHRPWEDRLICSHVTVGTYLQPLLTSKNRDTPVCAAATSMCRTTSAENRVRSVRTDSCVPGRSCSWPQAWPRVPTCPGETPAQTRAPTCPGRHQLMQFPHGHATGIVEVGHVQGHGRVRGIHQEVSYHKDGPHLIQPGLPVTVQPGGRTVGFTETVPPRPHSPAAPFPTAAAPWDHLPTARAPSPRAAGSALGRPLPQ